MSLISIRRANSEDASAISKVHYDAVHITAAQDYDKTILEQWSAPVTEERIENYQRGFNAEKEITLVALIDGEVIGVGSFVPDTRELNAIYVSPAAVRQGVGKALLKELEKIASSLAIKELWLHSSLTAEKFYLRHGFINDGKAEHTLRSGLKMPCIKMHKHLQE